jgi:hypothetical protein
VCRERKRVRPEKLHRKSRKFLALPPPADILSNLQTYSGWAVSLLPRVKVMMSSVSEELDFIQELRLRRWARENYVPAGEREASWHPVIHDEMNKKDRDLEPTVHFSTCA